MYSTIVADDHNVLVPVEETLVGLVLGTEPGPALPPRLHTQEGALENNKEIPVGVWI